MKIQCDVCQKEEASVFCAADEAALCHGCDQRVHHANKLAGKHHRFSLHNVKDDDSRGPLCDICQERRAFLFCKEDRAILCRECDLPIHTATEHTRNHTRFLLTGVRLSASSSIYQSSEPADSSGQDWRSSSSSMSPRDTAAIRNNAARSRPVAATQHSSDLMMMMNGTATTPCFGQSNMSSSSAGGSGGGYYYSNSSHNQQVGGSDHEGSISTTNNDYYHHRYNNLTTTTDYYTSSTAGGWNDVAVDDLFDSSSHFFGYDHKNVAESTHCQW